MQLSPRHWPALSAVLGAGGVAHFAVPGPFRAIVPRRLGDPRRWVAGSGVAELLCALGLVAPRTRRAAALASAALFAAVFPANLQMAATALRSPRATSWYRVASVARLPLQVPLVGWALGVARSAPTASSQSAQGARSAR